MTLHESCVFKTEFVKALLSFLKCVAAPSPTQYNVETLEKLRVHVSNIAGGVGGGVEQVKLNSRVTVCLARVKKREE